ncbi:hypothetical protein Daesc_005642 [Daldinia eschscholtzii]|uniref:Uncharacterized protein n=1 Tax=Daldinia eschscholtzii TaxID=292717 RepID=A0AAX6ML37_9PEZI
MDKIPELSCISINNIEDLDWLVQAISVHETNIKAFWRNRSPLTPREESALAGHVKTSGEAYGILEKAKDQEKKKSNEDKEKEPYVTSMRKIDEGMRMLDYIEDVLDRIKEWNDKEKAKHRKT